MVQLDRILLSYLCIGIQLDPRRKPRHLERVEIDGRPLVLLSPPGRPQAEIVELFKLGLLNFLSVTCGVLTIDLVCLILSLSRLSWDRFVIAVSFYGGSGALS